MICACPGPQQVQRRKEKRPYPFIRGHSLQKSLNFGLDCWRGKERGDLGHQQAATVVNGGEHSSCFGRKQTIMASCLPYQCSRLIYTWISLYQIMGTQNKASKDELIIKHSWMSPTCYVTAVRLLGLVCVFSWMCWELMCQAEMCN